jgi:cobalamin biosynthesis protein CbiG
MNGLSADIVAFFEGHRAELTERDVFVLGQAAGIVRRVLEAQRPDLRGEPAPAMMTDPDE